MREHQLAEAECGEIVSEYTVFLSRTQAEIAHARWLAERACFEAGRAADRARERALDVMRRARYDAATMLEVKEAAVAVVEAEAEVERRAAALAKTPRPTEGWEAC